MEPGRGEVPEDPGAWEKGQGTLGAMEHLCSLLYLSQASSEEQLQRTIGEGVAWRKTGGKGGLINGKGKS